MHFDQLVDYKLNSKKLNRLSAARQNIEEFEAYDVHVATQRSGHVRPYFLVEEYPSTDREFH